MHDSASHLRLSRIKYRNKYKNRRVLRIENPNRLALITPFGILPSSIPSAITSFPKPEKFRRWGRRNALLVTPPSQIWLHGRNKNFITDTFITIANSFCSLSSWISYLILPFLTFQMSNTSHTWEKKIYKPPDHESEALQGALEKYNWS